MAYSVSAAPPIYPNLGVAHGGRVQLKKERWRCPWRVHGKSVRASGKDALCACERRRAGDASSLFSSAGLRSPLAMLRDPTQILIHGDV